MERIIIFKRKGIGKEKGFVYDEKYFARIEDNKKGYTGLSNLDTRPTLSALAERIAYLHKNNIGSWRNQGISFEKPFEIKMDPDEIVKYKNLNILEKIIFLRKLRKLIES